MMEGIRPSVSLSTLDDLLVSEYRLKILESFELNGCEDRNFHVVCRKLEPLDEIVGSLNLNIQCFESSVQNNTENGLTVSTRSNINCGNCGFLAEDVKHKNLGCFASELRNEGTMVSNRTDISKQSLEKDTCSDCSFSASSAERDVSLHIDILLKVVTDETWDSDNLDDCENISKVERVELQMKIASHLRNCGFVCPEAVMSVSKGSLVQELTMNCDGEADKYLVYLTKYIFGSTLGDLHPLSFDVLFEVGNLLAQLHQALKDIDISHEKLSSASPWSLDNAEKIKDYFSEAELDAAEQKLASDVLDHFSQNVLPQLSNLPQGVIHGDFHDENILLIKKTQIEMAPSVKKDSCAPGQVFTDPEIIRAKYAVIDFGDVTHSPFMFDLAIAASYFMMTDPRSDFLRNVAHFLCGYFTSYKPTAMEFRLLFSSVCAAYCRETVLCMYTYIEQGRSNPYVLTAVDAGWRQLKELWTMGQEDVLSVWSETWEKYGLLSEF